MPERTIKDRETLSITCQAEYLLDAMKLCHLGGRTKKGENPSVMLDASTDSVVFVRRSYDRGAHVVTFNVGVGDAQASDTGNICLPVKELLMVLKSLGNGPVTFETDYADNDLRVEDRCCRVKSGMFDIKLKQGSSPDLLHLDWAEEDVFAKLDAKRFAGLAKRIASTAAIDSMRPCLTRVNMELDEETATFVSADGFRMARETMAWQPKIADENCETSVLIPAEVLTAFLKFLKPPVGDVEIQIKHLDNAGVLSADQMSSVSFQLINTEKFPDWRKLIDMYTETNGVLTFKFDDFDKMVRVAHATSRYGLPSAMLQSDDGKIVVTSTPNDLFGGFRCDLPGHSEGDERIALNTKYLSELAIALKTSSKLDGTEIDDMRIEIKSTQEAAKMRVDNLPEYLQLIMPMYVQWSAPDISTYE